MPQRERQSLKEMGILDRCGNYWRYWMVRGICFPTGHLHRLVLFWCEVKFRRSVQAIIALTASWVHGCSAVWIHLQRWSPGWIVAECVGRIFPKTLQGPSEWSGQVLLGKIFAWRLAFFRGDATHITGWNCLGWIGGATMLKWVESSLAAHEVSCSM